MKKEMLGHATNVEIDVEDSNAGFNNPPGRGADGNDCQFRMRGSPAGASRDFVESSVPVDLYNVERAEIFRASVAWEGGDSRRWFGRHRIAGLLENSRQDRLRRWRNEILVDDKNVPITNAGNAEGAQNQLTRRHYFEEGDFKSYYAGNSSIPVPEFTLNGRRVHATYAGVRRIYLNEPRSYRCTTTLEF